jgi:hypothetical protein
MVKVSLFSVSGPVDGDKEEEYEDIRQVLGEDKTSQDEIRTFAICSRGCKVGCVVTNTNSFIFTISNRAFS